VSRQQAGDNHTSSNIVIIYVQAAGQADDLKECALNSEWPLITHSKGFWRLALALQAANQHGTVNTPRTANQPHLARATVSLLTTQSHGQRATPLPHPPTPLQIRSHDFRRKGGLAWPW